MFQKISLILYLRLYFIYVFLYKFILNIFGPFYIVYSFDKGQKKNITFSRYFFSDKSAVTYVKTLHADRTDHLAYYGSASIFNKITNQKSTSLPKRKKIMFLNGTNPVNFDLNQLDNYEYTYTQCIPVTNLGIISKLFDIEASAVQIINLVPFKKEVIAIENANIHMLYE